MIIREMQSKLATWSTEDPNRKFDRLLRLIASKEWLNEAARITLTSKGARTPGIDGVNGNIMLKDLSAHIEALRDELLSGSYQPLPVRRIYIPKPNGKQRPLGIPCLRDRIVQRAMLMAMEPIWESDFHGQSYGFRPERSVHHAIRTIKLQLQDGKDNATAGRWVIEGDLSSYFDTVHHRILMKAVRKRICDRRFLNLLWVILKSGLIDNNLFWATDQGVPQGGVISPLLSNIMLHEFDSWMEETFLNKKVRKDRWAWNHGIKIGRPIAVKENRQWKPAIAYCRYADDFVVIVKGTKAQADEVREQCRAHLEGVLRLTLNMEKTHITHVNDGFVFLGHHVIRKRGSNGKHRVVTNIPWDRYRRFVEKIVRQLSGNYNISSVDMVESLNQQIKGWVNFYQYTDYTATIYRKIDQALFWKFGHWLARKYKMGFRKLMPKYYRTAGNGIAKTWIVNSKTFPSGVYLQCGLKRLVSSFKGQFRWRTPMSNPYLPQTEERLICESYYAEVAFAVSNC